MTVVFGNITPPRVVSGVTGLVRGLLPKNGAGQIVNIVKAAAGSTNPASNIPSWQKQYGANSDGYVTSRPSYPDTSYGAFLKAGGNLLGINYNAWKDRLIQNYNTAVASYEDWYNSEQQQVGRIKAAGLNTNLAYGQASPGSAGSTSMVTPSGQTPGEVFGQGAQILSSLFGNIKVLGEAAKIVAELPESRFKGRLAKQLDVAAAAGSMNSEFAYMHQLNSARVILGAGTNKANAESSEAAYRAEYAQAEQDVINYMSHHTESGEYTPYIELSQYGQGAKGSRMLSYYEYRNLKTEYNKNQKAYDHVFSNPEYWQAVKDKMIADKKISQGQAYKVDAIMNDPNMDPYTKMLALESGMPGFLAKMVYSIVSRAQEVGKAWATPILNRWRDNHLNQ